MRRVTSLTLLMILVFMSLAASAMARRSVLVVGDSLSIPLAKQLRNFYSLQSAVEFHSLGKVSSGLARPDFFDWEENLRAMASRYKPGLLWVMLGTNDHKPMPEQGHTLRFASRDWNREYARRVQRLIDIARKHNPDVKVFWVGAPVMGKSSLDKGVQHINGLIKAQMRSIASCRFIDTRDVLADEAGRYVQYVRNEQGRLKLRADDGVHITSFGAALLADRCLQALHPGGATESLQAQVAKVAEAARAGKASAPRRLPARTVAVQRQESAIDTTWALQESSWSSAARAKKRAGQLSRQGMATWVRTVDLGAKGIWHRVMIGVFKTLDLARKRKIDLSRRFALEHTLIVRTG